ncbi:MAG: DNA replication/repair protein RecF [Gammaproteobacteria bacterium]|nr:DNA replication/repair protein RecF [Gammaproteobacteria bacterium]MCW8971950.1 DNA replication/repair protein RecF [Gammaproteobacteria bacterium]MCW8992010.1 DNA replication/repair protein RecF [Gammaproteobacteria bacterium]
MTRIEIRHLRNLSSVSLLPSPGLNILEGVNASGKTSFIEAIHILGLARSFRTLKVDRLVQHGQAAFTLFAEVDDPSRHRLGIERTISGEVELRLDGRRLQSRSELASLLPFQLITPESITLLTGSPSERRSFIDWTMFHVEPNFQKVWNQYNQNLKQRNALLRQQNSSTLGLWSQGVVEYGVEIDRLRKRVIERLLPHLRHYVSLLVPEMELQLGYRQGWRSELSLADAMEDSLDTDMKMHFTTCGPHRADIIVKDGKEKVADLFSRGQLKLLLCAMKLAQMALLHEVKGSLPVVLIDDLPAELDSTHRNLLLSLLYQMDSQVFVTTTSRKLLDFSAWSNVKVFHVEHGEIKEVV